jgi:hypothetical protein
VAVISPQLNAQGMPLLPIVASYGARPLLVTVAAQDAAASDAGKQVHAAATGTKELRSVPTARGGLNDYHVADPNFARNLTTFVKKTWDSPPPPPPPVEQKSFSVQGQEVRTEGNPFGQ